MKVSELIEKLQNYPPNTRVIIAGYESGYDDVNKLSKMKIVLNYPPHENVYYLGKHQDASVLHRQNEEQLRLSAVDALWLH
jgi:hypothetical protein